MLENIPSQSTITELLGQSLFEVWQALCSAIIEAPKLYVPERSINQLWHAKVIDARPAAGPFSNVKTAAGKASLYLDAIQKQAS